MDEIEITFKKAYLSERLKYIQEMIAKTVMCIPFLFARLVYCIYSHVNKSLI